MGKTEQAGQAEGAGRVRVGVAVKTLPTPTLSIEIDIPPRSRLYGLVPREAGIVRGESLTSYMEPIQNRGQCLKARQGQGKRI